MSEDSELLRRYAETRSEAAFAELVKRRIGLVYSVALRQVGGDAHLAEDVTQRVFTDVARKAATLARRAVLSGWLYRSTQYAASDVVRSERRRRVREHEHHLMTETLPGATEGAADWERLRPVIDEAMADLSDDDRDAVALRFLEEKSFAEIGRMMRVSDDTARKRVERALARLGTALARRGVTSTSAALGAALATQASVIPPATLTASVTAAAIAGGAAVAAGGIGAAVLGFMSSTTAIMTMGAVALVGGAAAVQQTIAARHAAAELVALRSENEAQRQQLKSAREQLEQAVSRASAAESDSALLVSAIQESATARAALVAQNSGPAPITHDLVTQRYRRAQELARNGNWEAALPEFLWCYDEGMLRVTGYSGVRSSFLLSEIGRMAKSHAPAAAALRERRDRAHARLLASATDRDAARDYAALNRALGEDRRTLELYDSLPKGDPRRVSVASLSVQELLIDAGRYADVLEVHPYERMVSSFNMQTSHTPNLPKSADPAAALQSHRTRLAVNAAKNVEVLAGAGDLERAREFAQKVLAYDNSPETRASLQKHFTRAGHPDLLGTVPR